MPGLVAALLLAAMPADFAVTARAVALVVVPGQSRGTAWLADADRRLLVTCRHVVGDAERVELTFPEWADGLPVADPSHYTRDRKRLRAAGRIVSADVLLADDNTDLAILRAASLPEGTAALPLGSPPAPGTPIHTVGHRADAAALWLFAEGTVRQTCRSEDGYPWEARKLGRGQRLVNVQLSVAVGDSGSPLVAGGRVVGVICADRRQADETALAVSLDAVRDALKRAGGEPGKANEPMEDAAFETAAAATVWIRPDGANARCAGWVLDRRRGLIVTALSGLAGRDRAAIRFPVRRDGRLVSEAAEYRGPGGVSAWLLARDVGRDLAILECARVPAEAGELTLADADPIPATRVSSVGHPAGLECAWALTAGVVRQRVRVDLSGVPAAVADRPPPALALVLQAPLSAGDAGAALTDARGRVVGVVSGRDGRYAVAGSELRAFLTASRPMTHPAKAGEYARRSALHLAARRFDRARADADAAVAAGPEDADALRQRSAVRLWSGRPGAALADADAAIRLDGSAASLAARSAARMALGDRAGALADADAAVRKDTKLADAWLARSAARTDPADALSDADEAVWLAPGSAAAYRRRGLCRRAAGDATGALADLSRAVDLGGPGLPAVLLERAGLRSDTGDPQAAEDFVRWVRLVVIEWWPTR